MSLSSRLVWTVTLTVAVALAVFVSLTAWRLNQATRAQARSIEHRMQAKFSQQLELEGKLAVSFLQRAENDVHASVSALAGRNETRELIERGNIVAIDMTIAKAAASYHLDSVVVFDRALKAVGSHQPGLNLLTVNEIFASSPLAEKARGLLDQVNRDKPVFLRKYFPVDAVYGAGIGMKGEGLAAVSIHPVFDEFGDVLALVVGHRLLSGDDLLIDRFTSSRNLGIEVLDDNATLMQAGLSTQSASTLPLISYCAPFEEVWKICVHTPRAEMTRETGALTKALAEERDGLIRWVSILSAASLILAALFSSCVTRRVMAPLAQITNAVRSVAKGNWMARVAGRSRPDEVGEIARAVTVLQQSVKEREQLQADVADVNALRNSRAALQTMLDDCRTGLRKKLFRLSDASERVQTSLDRIASLTSLAEGEADESRLVSMRLIDDGASEGSSVGSQAKLVRDAIDRLSETISTIGEGGKEMGAEVEALLGDVSDLDRTVKRFLIDVQGVPSLPAKPASEPA
ncbi:HAMP domain-containing protein [Pseudahrensia aquimaris]|uniref:histidine kinase n=1 Tax=Pseudahrensia aquimaris TaxID=744461 RepID=A0ABW3FJU6_9HYPH